MTQNSISFQEPLARFEDGDVALIRVPDVSRFGPRPIRAESWSEDFVIRRAAPRSRPRRRLRREIRMTVYACLATLPLVVAVGVWSIHATARRAGAAEIDSASAARADDDLGPAARPLVWLTLEPAETNVEADPEPPVVFPGYLLPPDHREEPNHEGS